MRRRGALGLVISGIGLSIFGGWWTVYSLERLRQCLEGPFAFCRSPFIEPLVLASGIIPAVTGALSLWRARPAV